MLYGEGSRRPTAGLRKRGSVVTWNGYPVIRAESPLAIDGEGAFELLGGYEVGALVGLRGPIIGRGISTITLNITLLVYQFRSGQCIVMFEN